MVVGAANGEITRRVNIGTKDKCLDEAKKIQAAEAKIHTRSNLSN